MYSTTELGSHHCDQGFKFTTARGLRTTSGPSSLVIMAHARLPVVPTTAVLVPSAVHLTLGVTALASLLSCGTFVGPITRPGQEQEHRFVATSLMPLALAKFSRGHRCAARSGGPRPRKPARRAHPCWWCVPPTHPCSLCQLLGVRIGLSGREFVRDAFKVAGSTHRPSPPTPGLAPATRPQPHSVLLNTNYCFPFTPSDAPLDVPFFAEFPLTSPNGLNVGIARISRGFRTMSDARRHVLESRDQAQKLEVGRYWSRMPLMPWLGVVIDHSISSTCADSWGFRLEKAYELYDSENEGEICENLIRPRDLNPTGFPMTHVNPTPQHTPAALRNRRIEHRSWDRAYVERARSLGDRRVAEVTLDLLCRVLSHVLWRGKLCSRADRCDQGAAGWTPSEMVNTWKMEVQKTLQRRWWSTGSDENRSKIWFHTEHTCTHHQVGVQKHERTYRMVQTVGQDHRQPELPAVLITKVKEFAEHCCWCDKGGYKHSTFQE
ncbi:hypothetical protein H4582DRAFT_2058714 [Lactarius indigo]|nr:hypothetical protein H4582DRAFT_2058714 [Lactarius indigo]